MKIIRKEQFTTHGGNTVMHCMVDYENEPEGKVKDFYIIIGSRIRRAFPRLKDVLDFLTFDHAEQYVDLSLIHYEDLWEGDFDLPSYFEENFN
jgi:hypothetical protein